MRSRWKTRSTVFLASSPWELFANRGADVALIGTADGVKTIVNIVCPQGADRPSQIFFHRVQFGDFCHIYATILIYTLPFLLFLVFCPAISLWMTFLRDWRRKRSYCRDSFFDMLLRRTFVPARHQLRQNRTGKWLRYHWKKTRLNFCWLKVCIKRQSDSLRAAVTPTLNFIKARWIQKTAESVGSVMPISIGLRSRTHLTEERFSPQRKNWLPSVAFASGPTRSI